MTRKYVALAIALAVAGTGLAACHDHPGYPGEHGWHHHDRGYSHDGYWR